MTTPLTGKVWALRKVAQWCDNRAAQTKERMLLEECRCYTQGPIMEPVARFASALSDMIDANEERWTKLASQMRAEAEQLD